MLKFQLFCCVFTFESMSISIWIYRRKIAGSSFRDELELFMCGLNISWYFELYIWLNWSLIFCCLLRATKQLLGICKMARGVTLVPKMPKTLFWYSTSQNIEPKWAKNSQKWWKMPKMKPQFGSFRAYLWSFLPLLGA